eukprot:m.569467 g.569467  ORF g.569467 m.569467 type:complete len:61 (+) comp22260_c0_seq10:62-244(+)
MCGCVDGGCVDGRNNASVRVCVYVYMSTSIFYSGTCGNATITNTLAVALTLNRNRKVTLH